MKIGIIGTGRVGGALGPAMAGAGHQVAYGVRDPADPKYAAKYAGSGGIALMTLRAVGSWADIIILAINFSAIDAALDELGDMAGKILVDPINPYDFANGLAPLLPPDQSAADYVVARTSARVVKAFNQVGSMVMASASNARIKPVQFAASDDADAKAQVLGLMRDIGFDARDAGGLGYARELEGMARLWIAQAFAHGMAPTTGWALVETHG